MINQLEIRGRWYLPESPRRKISGTLKFSPNEDPFLEVEGDFQSNPLGENIMAKYSYPLILGISSKGEAITLHSCQVRKRTPGKQTSFIASFIFLGHHFKATKLIQFKELHLEFENLNEWYGKPWLDESEYVSRKAHVITKEPEAILIAKSQDYSIYIRSTFGVHHLTDEVKITHKTGISIMFSSSQEWNYCQTMIRNVQNFLGLAMTNVPYLTSASGHRGKFRIVNGKPRNSPIQFYYDPILTYKPKRKHFFEMLFTLTDTEELENALVNWIEKQQNLEPVFTLYFSIQHSPFMYLETRFLYLAQAVETYHRNIYGGKYQDDKAFLEGLYKKLVSQLPTDLDKDFRDSLVRGKFRYAHEYSLRKRLAYMFKRAREVFPEGVFKNNRHEQEFISAVVAMRNLLTHHDNTSSSILSDKHDLFYMAQRLNLLLESIFLEIIGFGPEKIKAFLKKSSAYGFIISEPEA